MRAWLLLLALPLAASAADKKPAPVTAVQREARKLTLVSVDVKARTATVALRGFSKPPQANLFTFTDDRERHFVAQTARCTEEAGKVWRCALEIPRGYEKHPLQTVGVHVGGLKARQLFADPAEVAAVWAAGANPGEAQAGGADGGMAPADAGR